MSSPGNTSTASGEVPPSQAIIEAIAAQEGVDPTEMEPPEYEPLYSVVNPEALDSLFRTSHATGQRNAVVALEYEGYDVVVHGDGRVDVHESGSDESPLVDRVLE
ncbi:hypothetical protein CHINAEXTREME_14845 [Halobiforma lacisalsi AJ5]|uniref:Halobacterial output domain-containing protein n=1 Tax=Natronobacterium lacisalsi AJ5 TaxID=358396 RepID=M0LBN8_NATLA|nr:HalOD1 output domain-containing protein [Halobiforma lacisalsi]APW98972.1 hypothetical protein CHINAEXTREME_14845 [Halobiforma lacisalsi AJ5]EMA30508.1 hypothetical protein C445_16422 [Halobiforma lacisalsi AJ5]